MALVLNPQTGQYEEDGSPTPSFGPPAPAAPPPVAPPVFAPGEMRSRAAGTLPAIDESSPRPPAPAPAVPTGGQASTITIPGLTPQQPGVSLELPAEVTNTKTSQDTRATTKVSDESKAALAEQRAALGEAAKAEAERTKAAQGEAAAAAKAAEEKAAYLEERRQRDEEKRKVFAEKREAAQQYLDEKTKAYEGAKITDFWADKSTGAKILAAVSVGLSGIGAAMQGPGARNGALDVIDKAIERDFQLKRAQVEKSKEMVELARTRHSDAVNLMNLAEIEIRNEQAAGLDLIASRAAAAAAKFGETKAKAEGMERAAQLQAKAADLRAANGAKLDETIQHAETKTDVESNAKSVAAVAAATAKGREGGIFGTGGALLGSTGDKTRDKEVSEQFAAYRDVDGLFDKLQKNFEKHGTVNLDAKARAEREQISKALAFKINRAEKLGALDNSTLDLLKEMVPGGNWSVFTRDESALEKLRTLRESSRTSMRNTLDGAGLRGDEIMPALSPTKGEAPQMSPSERALRIAEINKRLMDPGEAEDTKVRLRAALEGLTRRGGG